MSVFEIILYSILIGGTIILSAILIVRAILIKKGKIKPKRKEDEDDD